MRISLTLHVLQEFGDPQALALVSRYEATGQSWRDAEVYAFPRGTGVMAAYSKLLKPHHPAIAFDGRRGRF